MFNQLKENSPWIKIFRPKYIDFDEYPRYSGKTCENFEKILMKVFNVVIVMLIIQAKKLCTWVIKES